MTLYIARQLIQLDLQLRQLRADGALQQAHRLGCDLAPEIMCGVVGDPFRDPRSRQRLEFQRRRAVDEDAIFLRPRGGHEHQHDVLRWSLEVLLEHAACILAHRADVPHHNHAPLGHHRWRSQ